MNRLAWQITRSEHDAENVVQSAWLNVFRYAKQFAFRSKVGTWLHVITRTEALTLLRRRQSRTGRQVDGLEEIVRRHPDHPAFVQDRRLEPDRILEARELESAALSLVDRLPEIERRPFVVCVMGDVTPTACARMLDMSVPAVKGRVHRSRERLRLMLSEHLTGEPRRF